MEELLEISGELVHNVETAYVREVMHRIEWQNRLIGLIGARGVGKTTLLLQKLKQLEEPARQAAYFSLDDLYFTRNSLFDTGQMFYKKGGKLLVLDEVHKYPGWAREIKSLYDYYKNLKIIFTGSSVLDLISQEGDLSRRAIIYNIQGLSFREYLMFNDIIDISPLSLEEIMNEKNLRKKFPSEFRPLKYFSDYLKSGYFPFVFEKESTGYHQRLNTLIRTIVEYDMSEIESFDIRNSRKLLQLLIIIAQQVPFKPNMMKLAEKSGVHRNSIAHYFHLLEKARLIKLLYPSGISISTLQKPEKIFLENTNYLHAMAPENVSPGTERETFFLNQLDYDHKVRQPANGDFEVDGKWIFEVGGRSKTSKQISDLKNAYVVKADLEYPGGDALPLWMFGFLY